MVLYSTEKFKSLTMILVHKQNSEFKGSSLWFEGGKGGVKHCLRVSLVCFF